MERLVVGQIVEFLVWVELAAQSDGRLHPFLPLWDRGIDGIVHRRTDGAYIAVQVKGRTTVIEGCVRFRVPVASLQDDNALLVGAFLDGDRLGPRVLVISEGDFKRLASPDSIAGRPAYGAAVNFEPGSHDHWQPHVVPLERLAERFGVPGSRVPALAVEPETVGRRAATDRPLGVRGEAEVIHSLAAEAELSIYRPFPDLETVEVVVRHAASLAVLGLQVKTVSYHTDHRQTAVDIQHPSFVAAHTTWMVVLAWSHEEARFHPECLVIPTMHIERIAHLEGESLQIAFTPGSRRHAVVEPYRRLIADLGGLVATMLERPVCD